MVTRAFGIPAGSRCERVWQRTPVLTLSEAGLRQKGADLLARVEREYRPDLLVGIRTGGIIVADTMASASSRPLPVMALTCRRPGTQAKRHIPQLPSLLARLPRPMADTLRVGELRLASAYRRARPTKQLVDAAELAAIAAFVRADGAPSRVLVVDDAVDTGLTLASVMDRLREACPRATFRSAVVTVTLRSPLLSPDFALYERVVCRFPWSLDAAH